MNVKPKSESDLKQSLIELMDSVLLALSKEKDVDTFLDKTDLFDSWEKILPEAEYPIFVMAVLNNIRKESILNVLVQSILNRNPSTIQLKTQNKQPSIAEFDGHPFC